MKYYIHRETGEPLATLDSMIDVLKANKVDGYPNLGERDACICLCVFPERWVRNGIDFHAIRFSELHSFKRVSREKFFTLCPDFGQFRHHGDETVIRMHYLLGEMEAIPKRKETFGN